MHTEVPRQWARSPRPRLRGRAGRSPGGRGAEPELLPTAAAGAAGRSCQPASLRRLPVAKPANLRRPQQPSGLWVSLPSGWTTVPCAGQSGGDAAARPPHRSPHRRLCHREAGILPAGEGLAHARGAAAEGTDSHSPRLRPGGTPHTWGAERSGQRLSARVPQTLMSRTRCPGRYEDVKRALRSGRRAPHDGIGARERPHRAPRPPPSEDSEAPWPPAPGCSAMSNKLLQFVTCPPRQHPERLDPQRALSAASPPKPRRIEPEDPAAVAT